MRRRIVFSVVFVALVLLVGGFGYFHFAVKPQMIREFMAAAPPPVTTVTAEPARRESWVQTVEAVGTLRAVQGVEVSNQVEGQVKAIRFDSGEAVEAGAPLVQLDDSIEQAELRSAQADLRNATVTFERQRELVERGAATRSAYDAALAARDSAAAAVERLRAVIAKKQVVAPFAGKLGLRRIDLGQYLPVGTAIVPLQRTDPIYADFPLSEQYFGVVRPGLAVEATLDAWPGEAFKGRIQSLDGRVNPDSRTFLVRAELPNPEGRAAPGMFANVTVLTGRDGEVVTVPRTAVTATLYGDSVLVVNGAVAPAPMAQGPSAPPAAGAPLTVERRFVRVGEARGERVAIGQGLAPGELVVTSGQIKIEPGMPVKVDNSAALRPPAERPRE